MAREPLVALLLSGVGLYGLVSFSVEQRVAELGIRRALGGGAGSILAMILREGAVLALTGVAVAALATLVPALRAVRADPMVALRSQ